jgi:hypothetical protein
MVRGQVHVLPPPRRFLMNSRFAWGLRISNAPRSMWSTEAGGHRSSPLARLVLQAEEILARIDARLLYARVDGVVRGGRLVLMELELIDPMLFLRWSEGAPRRFAEAVASFFSLA